MLIFYYHLCWFVFLSLLTASSLLFTLFIIGSQAALFLSVSIFGLNNVGVPCSFYFDSMSLMFMTVVCLISSCIMLYSYNYMSPYSKPNIFIWLTVLFIISMLLVVIMCDFFYIMLGWDGLGLVSFFLIVYYQNQNSITSGIFTLLMNRLGDCFFLLSIALMFTTSGSSGSWFFHTSSVGLWLSSLLVFTFMTKSALFPFSPWLPLAMAAPTPISALVHSSTLVTSGLYLAMRFSPMIFAESLCINMLLVSSIYTSFYAGFNAVFERDLKKLIALSTLSHLGFIGLALSTGNINLAFFHLLTHALFKSLLFMAMGDIMTNLSHSQDIRWLSQGAAVTPLSSGIMAVSIFNLLGLPGMSGFFSKDLVLESLNFSNLGVVLLAVIFTNVLFTFFYTLQLFYFIFQPMKAPVLLMVHKVSWPHATSLVALACLSTSFSYGYLASVSCFTHSPMVPFLLKAYPLLACVTMLSFMFLFGQLPASLKVSRWHYYSSMMHLSLVAQPLASEWGLAHSTGLAKSVELGLLSDPLNNLPIKTLASFSWAATSLISLNTIALVPYLALIGLVIGLTW